MTTPSDYYAAEAPATTLTRIVGYAKGAGLILTNLIKGSVPDQVLQAMTLGSNYAAQVTASLVRARASLDTATDPGDVDPYDATNAAATPRAGALSAKGAGDFGTPRLEETFATGIVTITNGSAGAISFAPEAVTFTSSGTGNPTYRNDADDTIYTNPDGTVTILAGDTLDIPIVAEARGTDSNAGAGLVSITTSLGSGVTATNAAAILASSREPADDYRARCRTAAAILSLQGPGDAYRYIALGATKDSDGNVFFFPPWGDGVTGIGIDSSGDYVEIPNARGDSLGINRVYVNKDSSTGAVELWFATASGAPSGGVITDLTNLFNAIYWPDCTSRSFNAAVEVPITIDGTVKAKAGAGITAAVVASDIDDAINAAFPLFDIGGYDQTSGAGTLYKEEIEATVNGANAKIYKVTLSSPSGDTALAKGRVAVPTNNITSGDVTIV